MRKIKEPIPLPEPAAYHPFASGQYDEKPKLFRLGRQFGNGERDGKILQFDNQFDTYRQQKLRARSHDYKKYVRESLSQNSLDSRIVNRTLTQIACSEYPEYFEKQDSEQGWNLKCFLTGEILRFDENDVYIDFGPADNNPGHTYHSGLDAIASQLQEDICVVKKEDSSDRLVAAHLCFPNRWSPADKINKTFIEIHQPVARFSETNPNASNLINAVLGKVPYVRFAWGLSNDQFLDHHPEETAPFRFENDKDDLYVRVERQVLYGFPDNNLLLFFIRTYYADCRELCRGTEIQEGMTNALQSMSPELLSYKGLLESRDRIVRWIQSTG